MVVTGIFQEVRADAELGVEVKAAQVQHCQGQPDSKRTAFMLHAGSCGLRVGSQRPVSVHWLIQIGFADENLVGKAHSDAELLPCR